VRGTVDNLPYGSNSAQIHPGGGDQIHYLVFLVDIKGDQFLQCFAGAKNICLQEEPSQSQGTHEVGMPASQVFSQ
jgi:hypothetical protein